MKPPSARTRRLHARILDQLAACRGLLGEVADLDRRCERVSEWSIAEHLEHLVRVDRGILKVLERAEPLAGGGGPTAIGRAMLFLGFIPRGRGRAPSFVLPRGSSAAELEQGLREVHDRFAALGEDLGKLETGVALARHHASGGFDGTQWLRFVGLHHHHHWKILRDVQRAAEG